MIKLVKSALILLIMSVCSAEYAIPVQAASEKTKSIVETNQQNDKQENEIRNILMMLGTSASSGDCAKIATLWSEDGVLIDELGDETRGRSALEKRFASGRKEGGAPSIELHPERISFPSVNVALVVGSVSRKTDYNDLPTTRFSMVLLKQNGSWLINQATETRLQEIKAADHLKELEWLIGKWQVANSKTTLEFDWGAAHNFITSKCISDRNGVQEVDTQVIGWDPRTGGIVSWHFDYNGGFAYAKWSKQTDGWLVDYAGVSSNGNKTTGTNTFGMKSSEEFTWQSHQHGTDGVETADTEILKINKVKP